MYLCQKIERMNTIVLKQNLDFQHYQLAVKALASVGVEVAEPHNPYEITEEDIRAIALAREDVKQGRVKSSEQVFEEAKAYYESFLDR